MQSEYRFIAQNTWDTIADSFDTTRQKPWQYCLEYIDSLKYTDVVVDIGCGNGRHLIPCTEQCHSVFGVDISTKLLRIVKKKLFAKSLNTVSLIHADAVHLPFQESCFDAALFIASLHNIQGKDHRRCALNEVARVLKPRGTALISVWSRWQHKYYRYFLKQLLTRAGEMGDIQIWWRQHNLNIPRFYHLYTRNEFHRELENAGLEIERLESVRLHSRQSPDNYFAVVRKR